MREVVPTGKKYKGGGWRVNLSLMWLINECYRTAFLILGDKEDQVETNDTEKCSLDLSCFNNNLLSIRLMKLN